MKNYFKFVLLFFITATISSCDPAKDEDRTIMISNELVGELIRFAEGGDVINPLGNILKTSQGKSNNSGYWACFDFVYPISLTDGQNEINVNSNQELEAYLANSNIDYAFVFPLSIVFSDNTQVVINNEEMLQEAIEECDDFPELCFDFMYPLDLVDFDGNIITVNSDQELFYEDEAENFVYPFNVSTNDGEITINSLEELIGLLEECFSRPCFEIQYPLTFSIDNMMVTVNNDEELYELLYNLNDNSVVGLSFPVILILQDNTQVQANNEEELILLFDNCYD